MRRGVSWRVIASTVAALALVAIALPTMYLMRQGGSAGMSPPRPTATAPDDPVIAPTPPGTAAGSAAVEVPPLVSRTQQQAIDLIKKVALAPGAVTFEESRRPAGTVLAQAPPAGTRAVIGHPVDIVIAEPVTVEVPPLVGRTQQEAIDLLKKVELALGAVTFEESRQPAGTVVTQEPPAGKRVAIGSRVDIVIAKPVMVEVLPIVSRTRKEAIDLLESAGLVVGDAGSEETRRPRAGLRLSRR